VGLIGEDDIGSLIEHDIFIPIPFFFGFDYRPFANLLGGKGVIIRNCDKWFFTDFESNAT